MSLRVVPTNLAKGYSTANLVVGIMKPSPLYSYILLIVISKDRNPQQPIQSLKPVSETANHRGKRSESLWWGLFLDVLFSVPEKERN